jgi:hypothetical protein
MSSRSWQLRVQDILERIDAISELVIKVSFEDVQNNISLTKAILFDLQKKGTGNREQIRNTHLHQFKAQSKRRCFLRCVARKKTVSLFQSHVFKHEFFLLESCPFPVPSEL